MAIAALLRFRVSAFGICRGGDHHISGDFVHVVRNVAASAGERRSLNDAAGAQLRVRPLPTLVLSVALYQQLPTNQLDAAKELHCTHH